MSCSFMVITALYDGVEKGFIIRGVDTTLIGQDAHFDLPVREVGGKREGNVFIH